MCREVQIPDVFGGSFVAHGLLAPPLRGLQMYLQPSKRNRYSGFTTSMMRRVAASLVALASFSAPAFADTRTDAKSQVQFGIDVAQRGLWREAIYRWERATQIDPNYAEAYNDLAVAYEHEGQLDKARKAYEKALELAPNNAQIRQNYELFKEINDRTGAAQEK
jgi:Flp pilus assembly protein TadD